MSEEKSKELLSFWEGQGVLKRHDDSETIYQVMEKAEKTNSKSKATMCNYIQASNYAKFTVRTGSRVLWPTSPGKRCGYTGLTFRACLLTWGL